MTAWPDELASHAPEEVARAVDGSPAIVVSMDPDRVAERGLANLRAALRALLSLSAEATTADTLLVVQELTMNALEHGRPPYRVLVAVGMETMLVAVHDGNPALPEPHPEPFRGLSLVWLLSHGHHGVVADEHGKWVWAQLPTTD